MLVGGVNAAAVAVPIVLILLLVVIATVVGVVLLVYCRSRKRGLSYFEKIVFEDIVYLPQGDSDVITIETGMKMKGKLCVGIFFISTVQMSYYQVFNV